MTTTTITKKQTYWENFEIPKLSHFLCAAISSCTAEASTFPLDQCKVRLQLLQPGQVRPSMIAMATAIVRDEGVQRLYSGLPPAVIRHFMYGGLTLTLYKPIRDLLGAGGGEKAALHNKIAAASVAGMMGQVIATPTDVVKIRLQADARAVSLGQPRKYLGTLHTARTIFAQEGVRGFYTGLGPATQRAAVISGASIASYDHTKELCLKYTRLGDSTATWIIASAVSGFCSTLASMPFDVIKTRMMANKVASAPSATPSRVYKSTLDCVVSSFREEGPRVFLRGFVPAYTRIGPWQVICFLVYENLSRHFIGTSF